MSSRCTFMKTGSGSAGRDAPRTVTAAASAMVLVVPALLRRQRASVAEHRTVMIPACGPMTKPRIPAKRKPRGIITGLFPDMIPAATPATRKGTPMMKDRLPHRRAFHLLPLASGKTAGVSI